METKKNRGGAPRKEAIQNKTRLVRVLFNTDEYDRLLKRKDTTKAVNLSTFIRTICLDKPMRMKSQLSTHQENVLSLLREMRTDILRIGVNVNQSAKRINNTTDYQNLQHEVNGMVEQITKFDAQLGELWTRVEADNSSNQLAYGSSD